MASSKKSVKATAEEKKRVALAKKHKVKLPFYQICGGVIRTSDGKAYHSPEEFFADGGARDWSNVHKLD